jgi:DNA polymerase III sliding clamp (beta) subunit (PCNA family)
MKVDAKLLTNALRATTKLLALHRQQAPSLCKCTFGGGGRFRLEATDPLCQSHLVYYIIADDVPDSEVSVLVDPFILLDIVEELEDSVYISVKDSSLVVDRYELKLDKDVSKFPLVYSGKDYDGNVLFAIQSSAFYDVLDSVIFAADRHMDDDVTVFNCVLFEVKYEGVLKLIASNDHHLALNTIKTTTFWDDRFLLDVYSIDALCELLKGDVSSSIGARDVGACIEFYSNYWKFYVERQEGNFLVYEPSIPDKIDCTIEVATADFLRVLDELDKLIDTQYWNAFKPFWLEVSSDKLSLVPWGLSEDLSTRKFEVKCKTDVSEPFCIGFNLSYLIDCVRRLRNSSMKLELRIDTRDEANGNVSGLLKITEASFLYLLASLRF